MKCLGYNLQDHKSKIVDASPIYKIEYYAKMCEMKIYQSSWPGPCNFRVMLGLAARGLKTIHLPAAAFSGVGVIQCRLSMWPQTVGFNASQEKNKAEKKYGKKCLFY